MFALGQVRMFAPCGFFQRMPRFHGDVAVGFWCQHQDDFAGINRGFDFGPACGRTIQLYTVQGGKVVDLLLGFPVDPFATIAQLIKHWPKRLEAFIDGGVVPLHGNKRRSSFTRDQIALALFPVFHLILRNFGRGVVQDWKCDDIGFDFQIAGRDLLKFLGNGLEDFPVRFAFIRRVHSRLQRVNERVHVRRIHIVLFIPTGGRQNDVGVDASRRHPEVDGHQQVQLAARRVLVPLGFLRQLTAIFAKIFAHDTMIGAQQVLEEVFVALTGRSQQVRAPDKQVTWPVGRIVRVLAGHFQIARLQIFRDISRDFLARCLGRFGDLERVGFELRRRGQPAHAFGPDIVVDHADVPVAFRRCRRQDFIGFQRLITPLISVGIPRTGRVHVARRTCPVQREGQRLPARLRTQLFLPHIVRPAATGLTDAATHHQHVDDPTVVHIHVVPVVHRSTDDDHRLAICLFRILREFTGNMDDLIGRHACYFRGPCGCARHLIGVVGCDPITTQSTIKAVVGAE